MMPSKYIGRKNPIGGFGEFSPSNQRIGGAVANRFPGRANQ
jgi:hypothetical protein